MDALSEANGTVALTLLKKLGEDNSKNVFISPLSISSALAMVLMGARGNTAAQMSQPAPGRLHRVWTSAPGPQWRRGADLCPRGGHSPPSWGCPYPSQGLGSRGFPGLPES
ncbi:hypothetical protein FD755_025783 [Muntiacus reevesi]|uniref:Serpin domain-containing protein n=1 Tax=Muntiacus reevesi TaxID=9886 RepID=A0A5N3UIU9_MUNRE|nr:hypothetical protein FD755_025783 [Muntiacus reevesi]